MRSAKTNAQIISLDSVTPQNALSLGDPISWQADAHKFKLAHSKDAVARELSKLLKEDWTRADTCPEEMRERLFNGIMFNINHEPSGYLFASKGFNRMGAPKYHIEDLCISPENSAQGWGKVILASFAEAAKEQGIKSLEWETDATNDVMIRWLDKKFDINPSEEKNFSLQVDSDIVFAKLPEGLITRPISIDDAAMLRSLGLPDDSARLADRYPITGFLTVQNGEALAATFCTLNCTTFDPEIVLLLEQTYYSSSIEDEQVHANVVASVIDGVVDFCLDPKVRMSHARIPSNREFLRELDIHQTKWHVDGDDALRKELEACNAKENRIRRNDKHSVMLPYSGTVEQILSNATPFNALKAA